MQNLSSNSYPRSSFGMAGPMPIADSRGRVVDHGLFRHEAPDKVKTTSYHSSATKAASGAYHSVPQHVTVKVGEVDFKLSSKLLRANSAYFKVQLRDLWLKKEDKVVIPAGKTSAQIFEMFTDWLKTGFPDNKFDMAYLEYCHAYILGDFLQSPLFQNEIIDIIATKFRLSQNPPPAMIKLTFTATPPSSPLRRLVVDAFAWSGNGHFFQNMDRAYCPEDFLMELTCALFDLRASWVIDGEPPFGIHKIGCTYHEHEFDDITGCPNAIASNAVVEDQFSADIDDQDIDLPNHQIDSPRLQNGGPNIVHQASSDSRSDTIFAPSDSNYATPPSVQKRGFFSFETPKEIQQPRTPHDSGLGGNMHYRLSPGVQIKPDPDQGTPCPPEKRRKLMAKGMTIDTGIVIID